MEAEELYQRLLHLTPPWQVKRVIAEAASARVLVYLDQTEAAVAACPLCGRACAVCGETEEKSWRHLNTCQLQTHVFAKLALVDCPEHGEQPAAFPLAAGRQPGHLRLCPVAEAGGKRGGEPKKARRHHAAGR